MRVWERFPHDEHFEASSQVQTMSVNSIMNTGLSALLANQSALRATSNNIANVNTEGYVRQDAQTSQVVLDGRGSGVELVVQRAADRFLTDTHMASISGAGGYSVLAEMMDRAQSALGDPTSETSVFAGLDDMISRMGSLVNDPSSALRKNDFVATVEALFVDLQGAYGRIDDLRDEANHKLNGAVSSANLLMEQIAVLNVEIQKHKLNGSDASGAETQQSSLMNELAELMDFKAVPRDLGGVELRTNSGMLLVDHNAATLTVNADTSGARYPGISISPAGSDAQLDITRQISGGEIRGLLSARDYDLPDLAYALGEFSGHLADALNQAHNEGTSVPAPTSLTGHNTGLLATDALNFSGAATFAVVGPDGRTVQAVSVDFDAGTMTNSAGTVFATGATIGSFVTALNSALGGSGTAGFTNGQLTLSATGTNGVAIPQDPTNPSDRGGRGVSAFFGMNNLIDSANPTFYDTGLLIGDAHGFTSGSITFGLRNGSGDLIQSIDYTPTGTTMADLVNELNTTGVLGSYATASLDSNGRLNIIPNASGSIAVIDVIADTTLRGTTSMSMSTMFGLGVEGPAERARGLGVKSEIALNSNQLATSAFDTTATTVGSLGVSSGNNAGALALQGSLSNSVSLRTIGGASYLNLSITDVASQIASSAGSKAGQFESRATASLALRNEAETRRASVEGVNLDEEMVKMTVYQQSYSAASRLIQTSKDMYDVLLNMV